LKKERKVILLALKEELGVRINECALPILDLLVPLTFTLLW
jgi:hypothetical protein